MKIKDLSLHKPIKRALKENKIEKLTEIQQLSIPVAMSGKDILGISKTGSGKTLCFVIPLLHRLVDIKWCMEDGLGCLIITPTRELAIQIFSVLKKIGKNCYLSCGLIIGGIASNGEKDIIGKMNILVCTPGRLLHHILETPYFDISNVQILVIDETDKLLEMGFKKDILEIMSYLPVKRQNIFLSATPKSINQKNLFVDFDSLEIFSAYKCENEKVNEKNILHHFFYVVSICDKVEYLYTILKNNNFKKIIVFFSTCKEAKFYFLVFSRLKMRCKFYLLNGSIKQEKRIEVYGSFKKEKSGILFCTDVVSRGLDFPGVDVVIQYDCPECVETYVHRAGRTGRFDKEGVSILFLLESEKGIIKDINKGKWKEGSSEVKDTVSKQSKETTIKEGKKLEIKKIQKQIKSLVAEHEEIKIFAEKYIKTFYRFVEMNSKKYLEGTKEEICKLKEYFGFEDFSDESEEEFENIINTKEKDEGRQDNNSYKNRQDDNSYKKGQDDKKSHNINNSIKKKEPTNTEYLDSDKKINKRKLVGKIKNKKIIFDENGDEEEFFRAGITKKEIEEGLQKKGFK